MRKLFFAKIESEYYVYQKLKTMKKIFYLILLIPLYIIITGQLGCNTIYERYDKINSFYYLYETNLTDGQQINWGVAAGDSGKIITTDGRPPAPWVSRVSGTNQDLNACKVYNHPDSVIAFVVGDNATVLRSGDKGHTWVNRSIPSVSTNLYGLDFLPGFAPNSPTGEVNVVVCGNSGKVWKSTYSGGFSWLNISPGTTKKLNSVAAVNSQLFAVVGDSGIIYRTLDGGATWENRSISSSVSLKKIATPQYDRYCAVGTNGSIYFSTNYGYTWTPRSSGTTQTLRDVFFTGVDSGVVVGDAGVVRHTTNGGLTWLADPLLNGLTTRNILCIAQVDENTCNSITSNSTPGDKLADTTFFLAVSSEPFLGIEPISNFIADFFNLKQNYPNPFNPETKIGFDIPANLKGEMSDVKIIIYDISGKEIDILVNESVRAGQYEVNWNAANYPSGVYFYTILADKYKETRKMILLK